MKSEAKRGGLDLENGGKYHKNRVQGDYTEIFFTVLFIIIKL